MSTQDDMIADLQGTGAIGGKQDEMLADLQQPLPQEANSRRLLLDTVKRMVSMPPFLSAQPGYTLPEDLSNRNPALSISDNEAEALLRIGANVETGPLKLVPNLANAAERLIRYGIGNEDQPFIPSGQQVLNAGLSRSGINPEPANQVERYGTIAGETLFGAGALGAAGLTGLAARPATQMVGAVTGTAASDLVRKEFPDAPAWVAPAVGMATGVATGIASPIVTGAGKTGKAVLLDYQTEAGRKAAAGRMLNRFSTAPTEVPARIQRLQEAGKLEIIPGSNPLLSEVAQDEGLAVLTRVLPTTQAGIETGAISIRGNRMAQSDAAIRNLADRQFGTKNGGFNDELWNDVSNQQSALNAALRKQHNLDAVQVDVTPLVGGVAGGVIGRLKQRYTGKEKITGMLESLESQINQAQQNGMVSAQFLWNARQNLDDLIYEGALTSSKGSRQELGKVGEVVRRVYNSAITAKIPEFKPYLDEWAKLQRTKDRMTYGAELISGASTSNRNVLTQELRDADALYGEASITPAKYEQRLNRLKGEKREFNKLSPEQKETTGQVSDELRRRSFLDTGGLVRGSDTAQKLNANTLLQNDLMYSIFGPQYQRSTAANMLGSGLNKPLNWLTGTAVEDIMQQVQRGLIDPEYGALLMRETAIPKPLSLGSLMSSGGAGGRASLLFGR